MHIKDLHSSGRGRMKIYISWMLYFTSIRVHSQNTQNIFDPGRVYFTDNGPFFSRPRLITGLEIKNSYWPLVSPPIVYAVPLNRATDSIDIKVPSLSLIPLIAQRYQNRYNNLSHQLIFRYCDKYNPGDSGNQAIPTERSSTIVNTKNKDSSQVFIRNNGFIPLIRQNFNNLKQNPANAYPNVLDLGEFKNTKASANATNYQNIDNVKYDKGNTIINKQDGQPQNLLNLATSKQKVFEPKILQPTTSNDLIRKIATNSTQDLDLSIFDDNKEISVDNFNFTKDLSVFNAPAKNPGLSNHFTQDLDLSVFDFPATNPILPNIFTQDIDLSVFDAPATNTDLSNSVAQDIDLSVFDSPAKDPVLQNIDTQDIDLSVFVAPATNPDLPNSITQDIDLSVFDSPAKDPILPNIDTQDIDLSVFDAPATNPDLPNSITQDIDLSVFDSPTKDPVLSNIDLSVFGENEGNADNAVSLNQNNENNFELDLSAFDNVENTSTKIPSSWNLDLSIYDQFRKDFNNSSTDMS